MDGEEWWKRRGGPPAWNGADPDGWAGLPGPRPAQKLLLPADALAPSWGCGASFPGRPEQQAATAPRWSKAGGLRPRRHPEVGAQVETRRFGTLGLECSLREHGGRVASEGLRICKIVPSVWSGWKSPCAFELLRFGAEPGFGLLYSVFTDALKTNKKPRLPPRYKGKTVKSNATVHKSRGG